MTIPISWLLNGEPWVEYGTRLHLLDQKPEDKDVRKARHEMLTHPQIKSLFAGFANWDHEIISNHKNAGLLLHKLTFLADIGLSVNDSLVKGTVDTVAKRRTDEGIVQVPINIPARYGGTSTDTWGWCLCDTPLLLYSLIKLGVQEDALTQSAMPYLLSLVRDNGWGCTVSPELGKFKGPGKKDDPCPYATLLMLKAMAEVPEFIDCAESHNGAESLLALWEKSNEKHPYMFYMGTDFRKLKAPLIWYDIVHVAEVLSQFPWLRDDPRLLEMVCIIKTQADANGCYTPQSEWKAWKGWDFGQKKQPSRWLTLVILRLLKRFEY